ncbi:uncharacterized protein LOC121610859 [Chelmon rostratus]|uniref:uncharacterized protein LOC121610859 n=1 Tax=Chelmon rostratus TaxID=109905 RepID=UPI001BE58B62|nr:uncharacterized protein LOC121610859 [Chelmon rostratus]XP_041799099.1 uncharacterized protein LOC121610859 [Chelmon rostratus]
MEAKRQNAMADGFGRDLMNAGRFCFSCEQIFANRRCLEEHVCSAASFICSCGTEFAEYRDMLEHSTTHEPGHQVLDHETIRKRRIEKRIEEEKQLKRLQTGEVVWKTPKSDSVSSISLPAKHMLQVPITAARMPQVPMQSAQFSQVPQLYPPVSQASFLPNPVSSTIDMKNIFAGVGAPTVDLWTLYQPVVLLQTVRKFNKKKTYICGKCGQCFMTKTSLIFHHSSHVTDKISGCIGCGLLLSSKKLVPRYHVCNSTNNPTKFKLITARPLKPNQAGTGRNWDSLAGGRQATSFQRLKSQNLSPATKCIQAPRITTTPQLKNLNIRTYNQSNQGLHVTPSLLLKSQNPSASNPYVTVPLPMKSQSPNPNANKSSRRFPVTPSNQLKTPIKSASGVLSIPTKTSSASAGFTCRVCHIPFETAQLLQRHKCIKAQEFMAQHVRGGKQHYKLKKMTPVAGPNPAQMNGERRLGVPSSVNFKKSQVMAVDLTKGQAAVPLNGKTGVDVDKDCYIVESGPDKPAEMIYQVTSSVPIKT